MAVSDDQRAVQGSLLFASCCWLVWSVAVQCSRLFASCCWLVWSVVVFTLLPYLVDC